MGLHGRLPEAAKVKGVAIGEGVAARGQLAAGLNGCKSRHCQGHSQHPDGLHLSAAGEVMTSLSGTRWRQEEKCGWKGRKKVSPSF